MDHRQWQGAARDLDGALMTGQIPAFCLVMGKRLNLCRKKNLREGGRFVVNCLVLKTLREVHVRRGTEKDN